MTEKVLRFLDLSRRHAGVSEGVGQGYAEAARVCLDRHHQSPTEFRITDNEQHHQTTVEWGKADARTSKAWSNKDDTTEAGAYGLSLAAIEATRGLVAVARAETRTGADYYLGYPGEGMDDLEEAFRLEVSGVDDGNEAMINRRLRQKVEQARRGQSNLPAVASVVGFRALRIVSTDVEGT